MNDEVALIYSGKYCWAIVRRAPDVTREEHAPQMFNLGIDLSADVLEIDDNYPFPKVRDLFKSRVALSSMVRVIFLSLDAQLDLGTRQKIAASSRDILRDEYGQKALQEIRDRMLAASILLLGLDFNHEVIEYMPKELVEVLRELHLQHRQSDLPSS